MKERIEEQETLEEQEKLEQLLETYSDSELLDLGRRYVEDENYRSALNTFQKCRRSARPIKQIGQLYCFLVSGVLTTTNDGLGKHLRENAYSNNFIDLVIYCLFTSKKMHSEGELPKEDLFNLENLVDKIDLNQIDLNKIDVSKKEEFYKMYCKFKEYTADVFIGVK